MNNFMGQAIIHLECQPNVLTQVNIHIQNAWLSSNNPNEIPGPGNATCDFLGLNCPGKWIILALKLTECLQTGKFEFYFPLDV
nr:hypothetical transcript [Hymenolepis microstoma]